MRFRSRQRLAVCLVVGLFPQILFANDVVTIAVASNFANTAEEIVAAFATESDATVRISAGSTGKLYAQILHGAPYDIFLSADAERPRLLEQQGRAVSRSRTTYAKGTLVLWSRDNRLRGKNCREALERAEYGRVAIANPDTAPYGAATREFLIAQDLWSDVSSRAVYGENISQTLRFVATGNAGLGFVARSQTTHANLQAATCSWAVPETSHAPIRQQGVLLARAENNHAARRFFEFLQSAAARRIIREHGYRVPN
jgi:molybdate transport system substrate-binding protein